MLKVPQNWLRKRRPETKDFINIIKEHAGRACSFVINHQCSLTPAAGDRTPSSFVRSIVNTSFLITSRRCGVYSSRTRSMDRDGLVIVNGLGSRAPRCLRSGAGASGPVFRRGAFTPLLPRLGRAFRVHDLAHAKQWFARLSDGLARFRRSATNQRQDSQRKYRFY